MNGVAYVDEAGEKGLVRNLQTQRDDLIGLMCSLLFSSDSERSLYASFQPYFDRFCAAAPEGAKIHITDAFVPGNEDWAEVAHKVRAEALWGWGHGAGVKFAFDSPLFK